MYLEKGGLGGVYLEKGGLGGVYLEKEGLGPLCSFVNHWVAKQLYK